MIRRGPKKGPQFVRRHVAYRQVKRAISTKDTENTSVGATLEAVNVAREVASYSQTGKRFVKRIRHIRSSSKGDSRKPANMSFRADVRKVTANTLKSSGIAIAESLYTPDTTDSGMSSISMSVKTVVGAKDTETGLRTTVAKGKQVFHYVNSNRYQSKVRGQTVKSYNANTNMTSVISSTRSSRKTSSSVNRIRTNKNIRKASRFLSSNTMSLTQRGLSIIKAIAVKPSNLVFIGIAFLVIALFLSLTSATGAAGSAPASVLLADETVVQQYINKVQELDDEQKEKIENYKKDARYDDVVIEWMNEIGEVHTNWQELISIIAVEFEQDITFSSAEQKRLQELYSKLNYITTRAETYYCSGCETSPSGSRYCPGHLRLYVQVHSLDMEEIIDDVGLEEWEKDWVRTLVTSDWSELYPEIANLSQNELSSAEMAELMKNAPVSSATREEIRKTALSLVGKVAYFWGGKSSAGWNERWGQNVIVTSPGSSTTGTYQPYGLDCSGFTDWVYKTAGVGNLLTGGGSSYQWSKSYAIPKADLKVGDLVFKLQPGTSGTNHVGIYVGNDVNGNYLYCHCAYSQGVVINSYKGFKYFRRPYINFGE